MAVSVLDNIRNVVFIRLTVLGLLVERYVNINLNLPTKRKPTLFHFLSTNVNVLTG